MTFQAYLDNIRAKTGKGPEEFRPLAEARGLLAPGVKAGAVAAWLKADFDLGHGHAMAVIASWRRGPDGVRASPESRLDKLFSGGRAAWRGVFEDLLAAARGFGGAGAVTSSAADKYVSLMRDGRKFAILQPGAAFLDLGFKVPGAAATERLALAGAWNAMVTHRVRVATPGEVDAEVLAWLRAAYDVAAKAG
ncbi:DUF4287 domain-containing protein [Phenylobacterium sp.]|jgi:hypothetical protein|uniref:DUF4287 domain-containing protein n=1 Tax=Phenylobacterium sp. TaxID=1871053 RepID=UPI002E3211AF|nr:DUF4287 domain-containing protein [Phenylobacterium sp.]HEX3367073.1 DUF4287 domain-containing protein [Phenylobacterium sp.]